MPCICVNPQATRHAWYFLILPAAFFLMCRTHLQSTMFAPAGRSTSDQVLLALRLASSELIASCHLGQSTHLFASAYIGFKLSAASMTVVIAQSSTPTISQSSAIAASPSASLQAIDLSALYNLLGDCLLCPHHYKDVGYMQILSAHAFLVHLCHWSIQVHQKD